MFAASQPPASLPGSSSRSNAAIASKKFDKMVAAAESWRMQRHLEAQKQASRPPLNDSGKIMFMYAHGHWPSQSEIETGWY